MRVIRYTNDFKDRWNSFVDSAKNGLFLFDRDYMEYHSDRFEDASLVVLSDKEAPIALLPANRAEDVVYSHQGLTFGGVVVQDSIKNAAYHEAFELLLTELRDAGAKALVYKPVPYAYHSIPAQEDLHQLFRRGAELVRRDISCTVDLARQPKISRGRKRNLNKAKANGITVARAEGFGDFWKLLEEVLAQHHGSKPTHSLAEIEQLVSAFPDNIRLFEARADDGELVAGIVVYEYSDVAHTQYIANSGRGRELLALDLLVDHLLHEVYPGEKRYFDFGTSAEDNELGLNPGLVAQKEGFGGRAMVQDRYRLDLAGQ